MQRKCDNFPFLSVKYAATVLLAGYLYNTTTGGLDIDPANRAAAKEYDQAWLLGIPLDKVAHNILRK
jgi:hypothetical protein